VEGRKACGKDEVLVVYYGRGLEERRATTRDGARRGRESIAIEGLGMEGCWRKRLATPEFRAAVTFARHLVIP
jgi:hypothetical protein